MINCQCCTCRHSRGCGDPCASREGSGGEKGCAALWGDEQTDWDQLSPEALPKRVQAWISSWTQQGFDHGHGFLCPGPDARPCPGYTRTSEPTPSEWEVLREGELLFGSVYATTEQEALEVVHDVEGDDPDIRVRRKPVILVEVAQDAGKVLATEEE